MARYLHKEDDAMSAQVNETLFRRLVIQKVAARSSRLLLIAFGVLLILALAPDRVMAVAPKNQNNPFCNKLGKSVQASQGAQMFCFPPQSPTSAKAPSTSNPASGGPSFGSNVDAADPQEDVTPSGVQIHGQSETSVAASGPYVVEAWNDGTGFFAPCPSPSNKQELTGFGFSNDGGKTFTDLGGLPNSNCNASKIFGDPSVEAYTVGGSTYFYVSSIFIPFNVPENALSVTACQVTGAALSCSQPIVAAISSQCDFVNGFCSFLDKEFLSLDPVRGRLYLSYTEFFFDVNTFTEETTVELAVCDLSSPASPTCHNGSDGSITGAGAPAAPYFVVAPPDVNGCENEGAYPAVDKATGDVYVAYEHDWFTGLFNCGGETTQNVMNFIPFSSPASCLPLAPTSPCAGPAATQAVNITSLEAAFIPGYNRFPMNDFPRVAVSDPAGTVSMVWNDARQHGTGDIFLQSFNLGSLTAVQSQPVRINSRTDTGGWLFLPAVRQADSNGNLSVSFYSRSSANTALTNVNASLKVNPRTTSTPTRSDTRITTGSSDWSAVSSIIIPNFGDYTDNYFVGTTLFVAWSDGRLGFPQPFEDHVSVH
jgi:hypothetical protein